MSNRLFDRVEAIIVTYDSGGVVEGCLNALTLAVPVTVVDNDSRDGTQALVRAHPAVHRLIEAPANLGFGGAANLGLEQVTAEFALIVNPDCLITPETVERLVAAADRYPEAAILAPQHRRPTGQIHLHHWPDLWNRAAVRRHPTADLDLAGDVCAAVVAGAAMLLRMASLRQVGFFDPRIFLFYEDDDLCLRARQKGFATVVVADAWVVHAGGGSSRSPSLGWKRPWHAAWSRLHLEMKYHGERAARRHAQLMLLRNLLKMSWPMVFSSTRRRIGRAAEINAAWRYLKDRGYLRES